MSKEKNILIKKCIKGDKASQKHFFEQYGPYIKGVIWRYFKDNGMVEDIFIKAMYKILTNLDSLDDHQKLMGWMKRIAVNESLMELRKNKNNYEEPLSEVAYQVADPDQYSLDMDKIKMALNQLPNGYRTVFNLYEIDGYKHREIADILDISINTSKSQLIMAKKKLRAILTNMGFTPE
ncbi:MAG: RNA polymerase sigma factor [Saprospirales bacterium]|nr:MAG: RNA polymerase sigma factor [Saprospirales bacterium]